MKVLVGSAARFKTWQCIWRRQILRPSESNAAFKALSAWRTVSHMS